MAMPTSVSVIVLNHNGGEDVMRCLDSLRGQNAVEEILLVDNGSTDGSLERALARFPEIVAVRDTVNRGVATARNRGAALARGEVLLFLDHDAVLDSGCVAELAAGLGERDGVVGPVLRSGASGRLEWGGTVDVLGHALPLLNGRPPLYINGPVLATQRSLFLRLGGFDDRFFYAAEDVEYCWRVLLGGGRVATIASARADHVGGGSTPGGYVRGTRIETTEFRVRLRERYTLAVLVTCAPAWWLPWLVPAYVAKTTLVSLVVLAMGRPRLSAQILGGLGWNVRELPATLRRRRSTPRTPAGDLAAKKRLHRGFIMLSLTRKYGLPRFIDRNSG